MAAAKVTPQVLREITETLVRAADPVRIVLFGSHARGTAGPDSDLDVLVVEDAPFGPERDRVAELARLSLLLKRYLVPMDLLLYSRDEVARWRESRNHVVAGALREGKVLYERT